MDFPINTNSSPQVILELIYRLKIKDVMTSKVITSSSENSLRNIQKIMREKGITGVPIVEGDRLLGLVTIGDIITALDGGWINDSAEKHMTETLVILDEDMPLSFAITYFNRYGYKRFPVLNKDTALVGIVTAADVLRVMLIELNTMVEKLEANMAKARMANGEDEKSVLVRLSFPTRRFDFESAGKASGEFKSALKDIKLDPTIIRRAAIISYELEMNQVIHSFGGVMDMSVANGKIRISARDTGPGIADVKSALTEGFSTATEWVRSLGFGAGLGLPNAKRSADEFSIDSAKGTGTSIVAIINYGGS